MENWKLGHILLLPDGPSESVSLEQIVTDIDKRSLSNSYWVNHICLGHRQTCIIPFQHPLLENIYMKTDNMIDSYLISYKYKTNLHIFMKTRHTV